MGALLRFYARGAAVVAQRNVLATLAAVILTLVLVPDAPHVLRLVTLALFAEGAPRMPALAFPAVTLLLATAAGPLLRVGIRGWIQSLPLDLGQHRRAIALALVVPLAAPLAGAVLAVVVVAFVFERAVTPLSLLAIPIMAFASAAAGVPVARGPARLLAAAAAVLAALGTWWAAAGALLLLFAWDRVAGDLSLPPRGPPRRRLADHWMALLFSWRALGWRRLAAPLAWSAALLGVAWLYRVNNGLALSGARFVTRACVLAALLVGLVSLANGLVARRRPWPWARTLPWSSFRRIRDDGLAMALPGAITLAFATWLDASVALVGGLVLPLLAVLAALAVRHAAGRVLGAAGELYALGGFVIGLVSVWPALSLVSLGLVPVVVWVAARAERRLVATAWEPLHHDAVGDSLATGAG